MEFVFLVLQWELRMGFPFMLLAFLVFSHTMLLHSAGQEHSCPSSMDCGTLGPIKFPFTNNTYPLCGLCTVWCLEQVPSVVLGVERRSYQVSAFTDDAIEIKDPALERLITSENCALSSYLNLTSTPSISFTISPNLTLFKCISTPETDKYFLGNNKYRGCQGYTLYYTYGNQVQLSAPDTYPEKCVFFQLPMVPSVEGRNLSNPFSLLASEFSIRYHVSDECRGCHENGAQCARNIPNFQCMTGKGKRKVLLILGTAVAATGIFIVLLLCIIRNLALSKSKGFFGKNKTENYRNIEAFLKSCGSLSPQRYTYSNIKKMTNSFSTKLGQGGYGCVFKGKLENGCFVAVKVLKGLKGNGEEFFNEVAAISRTSHINIVTLLGFCFEGRRRALIYEFMPNGSLEKIIYHGDSSIYHLLGWETFYRIAVGIAQGLAYLHRGCNTRILHFDIKPHNILLDEDFCPKISDFGLAKLCLQKESIVSLLGARGTAGYIAPEVFSRNFGAVSHKSDVYSYGMMVLEIVGVRKKISVEVDHSSEIYFPHWIYKRLEVDEELGLHGIMNDEASESARKLIIVGLWCIQTDPSHRPAMSRVVEMLQGSTESLQIPPKPFLSSPSRSPANSSTTLVS